jgi:hypothetical protein
MFNKQIEFSFKVINGGENTSVDVIENIVNGVQLTSITDLTCTKVNDYVHIVNFKVNTLNTEGQASININVSAGGQSFTKSITIEILETIPTSYIVEAVSGVPYGFELNANGYYESKNKGIQSSYALCRVEIVNPTGMKVYFDCINYAEGSCDYGILSNVGQELTCSSIADTDSTKIKKNFKGSSKSTVQTVNYGQIEEGVIYVKFIKDSSGNSYNDTLQFKVRFEQ